MKLLTILLLLAPVAVSAQLANESELGMIIVDGNSKSETTNVKQSTTYKHEKDQVTGKARYTKAESNSVISAESWAAGARYDRELAEKTGAYLSHDTESNRFAGNLQVDSTGLGLTRVFRDLEKLKWSGEVGVTHVETDYANSNATSSMDGARLATKASGEVKEGVNWAFWIEYLRLSDDVPNTTSQGENYSFKTEPSLVVILSSTFSLKLAYLVQYQEQLAPGVAEHTDTTYSTTLVAKF